MDRPAQPDRYQPLPPLLQIPGYLVRKLSPRGKRLALLLVALCVVALAVGIPTLIAAKHRHDAASARAAARAQAARIAHMRAEIRRVDGHGTPARGLTGAEALVARRALVADLSAAVRADATRRSASGEFAQATRRVECSRYPAAPPGTPDAAATLSARTGRYACLAITADFAPGSATTGGAIGYPYRALLRFNSGRFAFCKISGRPGELVITRKILVPVPAACGGASS
jgi:hypothetical protein